MTPPTPPRLEVVGYELELRPCAGVWARIEGRIVRLVRMSPAGEPSREHYLPRHGVSPGQANILYNSQPYWARARSRERLERRLTGALTKHLRERRRLKELTAIANDEHAALVRRGRELIEHAIKAGSALLEARRRFHGIGWIDWMERSLTMHPTTAYRYMRIAEYADQVRESGIDSIEAVQLLADQPRRGHGPRGYSDADKAQWVQLVDEIGVKRTAALLGVAVSTISKWAGPQHPHRGPRARTRPTSSPSISDEAIERLARWLTERFGGFDYPERVTEQVRADALEALERAFGKEN